MALMRAELRLALGALGVSAGNDITIIIIVIVIVIIIMIMIITFPWSSQDDQYIYPPRPPGPRHLCSKLYYYYYYINIDIISFPGSSLRAL